MKKLPPNLAEGELQRKQIGGGQTVRKRIEVTLERETVTIFQQRKTATTEEGDEVCACCGRNLKVGLSHPRLDPDQVKVQPENLLSMTETNAEDEVKERACANADLTAREHTSSNPI